MEPLFLNRWQYSGRTEMLEDFGITESDLDGYRILLASYGCEYYEGSAFVLLARGGQLYEVNGSHCSCHGLSESSYMGGESQWAPEQTSIEVLRHRLEQGKLGTDHDDGNVFAEELKAVLDDFERGPQEHSIEGDL